jgi:hypothetical protein
LTGVLKLLAVILVAAFALSQCNSESRKARSELVASCTKDGLSSSICECLADEMFDHYGDKAMVKMQSSDRVPSDLARVMSHAAAQCRSR